jgi:hypothetical protein
VITGAPNAPSRPRDGHKAAKAAALIHHSDRGSQYAAASHRNVLGAAGHDPSHAPERKVGTMQRWKAVLALCKLFRQARSLEGAIPSSRARLNGRPLLASSPSASRLNSSVDWRDDVSIKHLAAPKAAYQRCPPF